MNAILSSENTEVEAANTDSLGATCFEQRYFAVVVLLTLLAFALRIPGLDWGMPVLWVYNSDTERFVTDAAIMASARDPNPHWFGHPGSTVIYPLAIVFALTNRIDRALGNTDEFVGTLFQQDPATFHAIGRTYTALLGAALIPIGYVLGKRSGSRFVGLVSACILTVSPVCVEYSHMARPDAVGAFWASLGLLASIAILHKPKWRYYVLAGIAFGLAVSSKYNLVLLVIGLPLAHAARTCLEVRGNRHAKMSTMWGRLAIALGLVVLTFVLTSPFFFIDFPTVVESLEHERRTVHLSADSLTLFQNAWWYLTVVIPGSGIWPAGGVGPVGAILAGLGILAALRRRNLVLVLYFIISLTFLAGMSVQALHWDRWIIPILPLVTSLSGAGLNAIALVLRRIRAMPKWAISGVVALVLLSSMWPIRSSIQYNVDRVIPNTRQLAQEWVETNLPYESRIIAEMYSIPITPGRFAHHTYVYSAGLQSLEYYCENEYDYIIFTEAMIRRYAAEQERYLKVVANYERIQSELNLVKAVEPEPWRVSGLGTRTIYIYQLSHCP